MARQTGPVKGSLVVVCEATAESTLVIIEPCYVTAATYALLDTDKFQARGAVVRDELGHPYIDFTAIPAANVSPISSGGRENGPTKGSICIVCKENASSTLFIIDPIIVDKASYNAILGGTQQVQLDLFADNATVVRYCTAGMYTP